MHIRFKVEKEAGLKFCSINNFEIKIILIKFVPLI